MDGWMDEWSMPCATSVLLQYRWKKSTRNTRFAAPWSGVRNLPTSFHIHNFVLVILILGLYQHSAVLKNRWRAPQRISATDRNLTVNISISWVVHEYFVCVTPSTSSTFGQEHCMVDSAFFSHWLSFMLYRIFASYGCGIDGLRACDALSTTHCRECDAARCPRH